MHLCFQIHQDFTTLTSLDRSFELIAVGGFKGCSCITQSDKRKKHFPTFSFETNNLFACSNFLPHAFWEENFVCFFQIPVKFNRQNLIIFNSMVNQLSKLAMKHIYPVENLANLLIAFPKKFFLFPSQVDKPSNLKLSNFSLSLFRLDPIFFLRVHFQEKLCGHLSFFFQNTID